MSNEYKIFFGGDFGNRLESECCCTFDCGSGSITRVDICRLALGLLLAISTSLFYNVVAQDKRILYEYESVKDSTKPNAKEKQIMVLDIRQQQSEFYEESAKRNDSTNFMRNGSLMGNQPLPVVLKDYSDDKTLRVYSKFGSNHFIAKDESPFHWMITKETADLNGMHLQKAITQAFGRTWEAWFDADIPINDGPYKFHGLPGLIVKLQDKAEAHTFNLMQIKDLPKDNFSYANAITKANAEEIPLKKFNEKYVEKRKRGNSALKDFGPNKVVVNGVEQDMSVFFRNLDKKAREREKTDNNYLEINMLKFNSL